MAYQAYRGKIPRALATSWEHSEERKQLLLKIRTFSPNMEVIAGGTVRGRVESINEQTLTVRVRHGPMSSPYSVKVVERATPAVAPAG